MLSVLLQTSQNPSEVTAEPEYPSPSTSGLLTVQVEVHGQSGLGMGLVYDSRLNREAKNLRRRELLGESSPKSETLEVVEPPEEPTPLLAGKDSTSESEGPLLSPDLKGIPVAKRDWQPKPTKGSGRTPVAPGKSGKGKTITTKTTGAGRKVPIGPASAKLAHKLAEEERKKGQKDATLSSAPAPR